MVSRSTGWEGNGVSQWSIAYSREQSSCSSKIVNNKEGGWLELLVHGYGRRGVLRSDGGRILPPSRRDLRA